MSQFIKKVDRVIYALRDITLGDFSGDEDERRTETADFMELHDMYVKILRMRNEHVRIHKAEK